MKADASYNDLVGTVAADIADTTTMHNELSELGTLFKLDKNRFTLIGLSLYGTKSISLSLLCIDKQKSTDDKEHIVSIMVDRDEKNILEKLFKRLHIVLYKKYDEEYSEQNISEEARLSDFQREE